MTNKQLSREGYEISGPVSVKNPVGRLMEAYQVRRLADGAELNLKFSTTARQDRRLEVCSAKPAKGWVIPEYDGCTFMALNETSDNPDTAARLPDPRHWAVLWLRKGIPPLKSWPGHFLADTHADREVVWTLLAEQIEAGIKRMERSRRDRAGEDTGLLLLDWARDLPVDWQDQQGTECDIQELPGRDDNASSRSSETPPPLSAV